MVRSLPVAVLLPNSYYFGPLLIWSRQRAHLLGFALGTNRTQARPTAGLSRGEAESSTKMGSLRAAHQPNMVAACSGSVVERLLANPVTPSAPPSTHSRRRDASSVGRWRLRGAAMGGAAAAAAEAKLRYHPLLLSRR